MGWTVLYIAFGIVALWLLGEVLLQYKARLRWRLLAFGGFLLVVLGVLVPSVLVIALGAAAFAVGQTYVTLSFRRGFAAGWAVGHPKREPGGSKRRRGENAPPEPDPAEFEPEDDAATGTYPQQAESFDDDRDDVFTPARPAGAESPAEATAVYEPQPMPDETGTYGVYTDAAYAASNAAGCPAAGVRLRRLLLRPAGLRLRRRAAAVRGLLRPVHRHLGVPRGRRLRHRRGLREPAVRPAGLRPGTGPVRHDGSPRRRLRRNPARRRLGPPATQHGRHLRRRTPPEQSYPYQNNPNGQGYDDQYRY